MLIGVFGNVVVLVEGRHELVHHDACVLIVGCVVLDPAIGGAVAPFLQVRLGLVGPAAGIDEYPEHHRNLAAVDEIIHHVLGVDIAVFRLESLPVLENHQAGRDRRIVLCGHVHPIGVLRARIYIACQCKGPPDLALRNPRLRHGIGA